VHFYANTQNKTPFRAGAEHQSKSIKITDVTFEVGSGRALMISRIRLQEPRKRQKQGADTPEMAAKRTGHAAAACPKMTGEALFFRTTRSALARATAGRHMGSRIRGEHSRAPFDAITLNLLLSHLQVLSSGFL
jgi:hypothetical protein